MILRRLRLAVRFAWYGLTAHPLQGCTVDVDYELDIIEPGYSRAQRVHMASEAERAMIAGLKMRGFEVFDE